MSASVGGGGESTNVELNLTAMIDLMSVLVTFLLMTAVWYQVAAIQASVDAKGKAAPVKPPDSKQNMLAVHVATSGVKLTWPAGFPVRLADRIVAKSGVFDNEGLTSLVSEGRKHNPELTAAVSGDDKVEYGVVAETIDAVKVGGVKSVAMVTN